MHIHTHDVRRVCMCVCVCRCVCTFVHVHVCGVHVNAHAHAHANASNACVSIFTPQVKLVQAGWRYILLGLIRYCVHTWCAHRPSTRRILAPATPTLALHFPLTPIHPYSHSFFHSTAPAGIMKRSGACCAADGGQTAAPVS